MNAPRDAGRIGVFGRSGSGKSTYAKGLLRTRRRVIVFDPLDEYAAEGFRRTDRLQGVIDAAREDYGWFRVAYVPPAAREPEALSRLCGIAKAIQKPYFDGRSDLKLTLAVEEMNMGFPVAGGAEKAPEFADACSRGRHYGIEIVGLAQRIAEVSTRFRGNLTETVILAQKGPRDRQAALDALGAEDAAIVSRLASFEYVHEKDGVISNGTVEKNPM